MTEQTKADTTATAPLTRAEGYSWYVLIVLVAVYVMNFIDRQIMSILANDIKAHLNIDDAYLGFLYGTVFAVFYALFGIPIAKLADNISRTKLLSAGVGLWSVMTAASGFAGSAAQLTGARAGVAVGEAAASPTAYSLISDLFPKHQRATALSIYSSGLYLGGGISLYLGGHIVERWNAAYPVGGPLGLVGWQAAFLAVGVPGLLIALLVASLREPTRGAADGIATPVSDQPWREFGREAMSVIPPFTLIAAARRGNFIGNIIALALIAAVASGMIWLTGDKAQWAAIGFGYYAVYSWATSLRAHDPVAFKLIWGTPAFLVTILGYGLVAFASYSVSFWAAPYAERVLGQSKQAVGWWVGAPGALAGFLGVILGGWMADRLMRNNPAGRILVIIFGLLAPVPFLVMAFTTSNATLFYGLHFIMALCTATALGAAAATSQDLVLPRMRGTATATFFLATTLVGLALGPYMAGKVSALTGNLSTGMLSVLAVLPVGLTLLIFAYRLVPAAEKTLLERARAMGEPNI